VTVLLELARIFGRLYRDPKTRPQLNLVFVLSAAGKWNFFGTKKWLEDHLDQVRRYLHSLSVDPMMASSRTII
jgi:hypothetical protein